MAAANRAGSEQAGKKAGAGVKRLKSGVPVTVGKKTQFKKGQSGNPKGLPKGTKHLSTHIQELMNDESFEQWIQHPTKGWVQEKGAPVKAIIKVLITRAQNGDVKAFDALAKYGYGTKVTVDATVRTPQPLLGGTAPLDVVHGLPTDDESDEDSQAQ